MPVLSWRCFPSILADKAKWRRLQYAPLCPRQDQPAVDGVQPASSILQVLHLELAIAVYPYVAGEQTSCAARPSQRQARTSRSPDRFKLEFIG